MQANVTSRSELSFKLEIEIPYSLNKLELEIDRVSMLYPKAIIIGLADGAANNWTFLKPRSDLLLIDFWHVTEYLAKASQAMFPNKSQKNEREEWLEDSCHKLKHNVGSATRILNNLLKHQRENKMSEKNRKTLQSTITYITNNKDKMAYYKNVAANMPIGSKYSQYGCHELAA